MGRRLAAASIVFLGFGSGCALSRSPAPPVTDPPALEFQRLLQRMADARWALTPAGAAQSAAVTDSTLHDSYVEVLENGDVRAKAAVMENRTAEGTAAALRTVVETQLAVSIDDVRVQVHGQTAAVTYLKNSRLVFNGEPVSKVFRCTETFVRHDGRWQSVLHTETVVPGEPVAASVAVNTLDDYVGEYRLTPSVVYSVAREGGRLLWGRSRQELVPENETTFIFKRRPNRSVDLNTSYRVIFVRDARGRVTHLRMREFPGVEYSAVKIK